MAEIIFEVLLNIIGGILEIFSEAWVGDLTWPDTKAGRIFWSIVILLLGYLIWHEWH